MKTSLFLVGCVLTLGSQLVPARADGGPSAFEIALYHKARYEVICRLNDEDFVSYCVTMNLGGETLIKIHDQILAKEADLADHANDSPDSSQVAAINAVLKNLKAQYAVKICEARKGLEVESKIAEETLMALSHYQK